MKSNENGKNSTPPSSTEVITDPYLALRRGMEFMSRANERMDIFFDKAAPSIVVGMPEYWEGYRAIRDRGGKIRALTEITPQNLRQCRELALLVDELRHADHIVGGIAVTESEYMATLILKEGTPLSQVIYSNDLMTLEEGQQIFNEMWRTGVPAERRFQALEALKSEVSVK